MTIYYLYVKAHKITGLKYLGYTGQADPYKYLGSGVYWGNHLKKHGKYIDTTILHECTSKAEIKEHGVFYSKLWNIVDAKDVHGNKIWANLKPEEGDGFASGEYHHMKSAANRLKMSVNTPGKKPENRIKSAERGRIRWAGDANPMKDPNIIAKHFLGENNASCRPEVRAKKIGSSNGRFDHNLYEWKNVITNEILVSTRYDMIHKYLLNKNEIIRMITGSRTSPYKGWVFVTRLSV